MVRLFLASAGISTTTTRDFPSWIQSCRVKRSSVLYKHFQHCCHDLLPSCVTLNPVLALCSSLNLNTLTRMLSCLAMVLAFSWTSQWDKFLEKKHKSTHLKSCNILACGTWVLDHSIHKGTPSSSLSCNASSHGDLWQFFVETSSFAAFSLRVSTVSECNKRIVCRVLGDMQRRQDWLLCSLSILTTVDHDLRPLHKCTVPMCREYRQVSWLVKDRIFSTTSAPQLYELMSAYNSSIIAGFCSLRDCKTDSSKKTSFEVFDIALDAAIILASPAITHSRMPNFQCLLFSDTFNKV